MSNPSQENPTESLTLKEIKKSYDQVLDNRKNLDIKASYILAATGTTTTLLFGFIYFIINKQGIQPNLLSYIFLAIIASIGCNTISLGLSLYALRIIKHAFVIIPQNTFDINDREIVSIRKYKSIQRIDFYDIENRDPKKFNRLLINYYLKAIYFNDEKNESRTKIILSSQIVYSIGIVFIIISGILVFLN